MANVEFNLQDIQDMKMNAYVKAQCKPAIVKKAKLVLLFNKLDLKGAKKSFIAVFFTKPTDAQKAFKKVKADGSHLMKHTALATVAHGVGTDGKPEVTLDVVKGALGVDLIQTAGLSLFNDKIGMGLKVVGAAGADASADTAETSADTVDAAADDKGTKKEANKAKRAAKQAKMKEGVAKMDAVKDTASADKLAGNIAKYEAALAKLIEEAKADGEVDADEQKGIDELTTALNDLKAGVSKGDGAKAKKLTPEKRAKMSENMKKMTERLDAIMAKLNI